MADASDAGSITNCLMSRERGDRQAAQAIWDRYFQRLVSLARPRLQSAHLRAVDEEDVVLSALDSFFSRAGSGQFPRLEDRDDLWKVLFVLTVRKAISLVRHERRPSRGGGWLSVLSDLEGLDVEEVIGDVPTPELAAQMADECHRLLGRLGNATLCQVAVWKTEGYTNVEIAGKLGCVTHTIERKLRSIREHWSKDRGGAGDSPGRS
ncbi:MAG TPA: ECF-type sigma factor [Isosphaeraceae bacterium]|nr:ECF-type sigma factor [Isosphaeraceae bacterium]